LRPVRIETAFLLRRLLVGVGIWHHVGMAASSRFPRHTATLSPLRNHVIALPNAVPPNAHFALPTRTPRHADTMPGVIDSSSLAQAD